MPKNRCMGDYLIVNNVSVPHIVKRACVGNVSVPYIAKRFCINSVNDAQCRAFANIVIVRRKIKFSNGFQKENEKGTVLTIPNSVEPERPRRSNCPFNGGFVSQKTHNYCWLTAGFKMSKIVVHRKSKAFAERRCSDMMLALFF
jgi:hypothetical protein